MCASRVLSGKEKWWTVTPATTVPGEPLHRLLLRTRVPIRRSLPHAMLGMSCSIARLARGHRTRNVPQPSQPSAKVERCALDGGTVIHMR